ncbi:MAG: purine-nucleoside phosphorylase [Pseudomonadota bacterium]
MPNDGVHSRNINVNNLPGKLGLTVTCLNRELGLDIPKYVVVLGSGLSDVLSDVEVVRSVPYVSIHGIPKPTVSGHKGVLEIVKYKNKKIFVMRGRFHLYEGNSPDDSVRLLRALALLGVRTAFLTNAAGSTSLKNKPGDLLILKDHLNMTNLTPLSSSEGAALGAKFLDMSEPYSEELQKKIKQAANKLKIKTSTGVYACMRGPQYETQAEVKMLKILGADAAGMSTVPEVIALRQLGVKIACITTITNYGTGVKKGKHLSHEEVKKIGQKTAIKLDKIFKKVLSS